MKNTTGEDFSDFRERCRSAVAQQVAGNTEAFQSLWSHQDDIVLIGAAGSHHKGWEVVSARLTWTSSHLNFGGFHVENLLTSVSGELAFTVDLEHMSRELDGSPQQRTLRVSQGYRKEGDEWRVVFRHGDPMAEDVLPQDSTGTG